ncbi:integrase [Thalassotalea eurytherma]|uniref:Integrase n=1 Tax=Thalassotalea eurytherma TaxID=1144278 RepID=A0ABQ6H5B1_9GAMM|nr:integrase [Thalassotalea eurytherma]
MYWRNFMPRVGGRKLYKLIKPQLARDQIKLGRDGLFDYLRQQGLLVQSIKSFIKTTHSKYWMKSSPNLLKARKATASEQVFVSDITYLKSNSGIHYLSLVTDAYSRKIMEYELSDEMKKSDVKKALTKAIDNRCYQNLAIHHSDKGLQYCAYDYKATLANNGIFSSMTDGYDCYQNALVEKVKGILKQKLLLYNCNDINELRLLVDESNQI